MNRYINCDMDCDMNWQVAAPFIHPHTVQADELDFLGHVNNKSYLTWIEHVSWQHARSVGISHELQRAENRIMAVYENCMQYLASCYAGEELLIATWIGKQIGCCRRERHFQIIRKRDQKTVFTAQAVYVCIDLTSHQPRRIPKAFIKPYQTSLIKPST